MLLAIKPQILPANACLYQSLDSGCVGVNKSVCFFDHVAMVVFLSGFDMATEGNAK